MADSRRRGSEEEGPVGPSGDGIDAAAVAAMELDSGNDNSW